MLHRKHKGEHDLGIYDGQSLTCSVIQVLNKTDLVSKTDLDAAKSWLKENDMIDMVLPTSARDGKGVDDVRNWALSQLPHGPSLYPKVSFSDQTHVSQLIGRSTSWTDYFVVQSPLKFRLNYERDRLPGFTTGNQGAGKILAFRRSQCGPESVWPYISCLVMTMCVMLSILSICNVRRECCAE